MVERFFSGSSSISGGAAMTPEATRARRLSLPTGSLCPGDRARLCPVRRKARPRTGGTGLPGTAVDISEEFLNEGRARRRRGARTSLAAGGCATSLARGVRSGLLRGFELRYLDDAGQRGFPVRLSRSQRPVAASSSTARPRSRSCVVSGKLRNDGWDIRFWSVNSYDPRPGRWRTSTRSRAATWEKNGPDADLSTSEILRLLSDQGSAARDLRSVGRAVPAGSPRLFVCTKSGTEVRSIESRLPKRQIHIYEVL